MRKQGNRFGAFKGVFTPSILTILGVIMYLRLPWIIGQAGLWATLGIILVAHVISATTGLSVASIATDKKVETGGTYYMISRSLGLPIGGTLGLALFVGLSFSVSLYIIGFSETLLNAFDFEVTLNKIRLTGVITLVSITIITFISTNLALKTQFVILAVLILSLVSIFMGQHDFTPKTPLSGSAVNSLPWIALFAIFFPAVTGFEAGVSMSGDLDNPKKAIPRGTIMAIIVGLVVYIGLVFFFSYTVERDALLNDSAVLFNISFYSPLVIAGIWGATLSSAFGSILGAPRILQATAMDRITPRIFAKGVGAGNEPRNAILLTFVIALAGILIGELNAIARVVSIFFIITYGFLNLTCAIENWAGSDFRPSFRIPAWVSIIGAIACFVVMIQLDFIAMVGATILLGAIFIYLKRKELTLQSGDTWAGFWSS
ncbi:MAG: amino acid permease, partial [Perlabentimonas sp.]